MTAEELLKPRFELVELYPTTMLKKGDIITPISENSDYYDCNENTIANLVRNPEKYPYLFRKLNWWEKRSKEQMPKRLKSLSSKDAPDFDLDKEEVFNILEWNMKTLDGIIDYDKMQVCSLTSWNPEYGYIPVD